MYWIGLGTGVDALNSQVVPISQVALKTGFTVVKVELGEGIINPEYAEIKVMDGEEFLTLNICVEGGGGLVKFNGS